ncbi:thiamine-phosphate kinase [Thermovibrio sp.]
MKLSEFQLIELFKKKVPVKGEGVLITIGDDTAVIERGEEYELITTDALVEGSHFKKRWKEVVRELFFYLGKKLVNVCASDVASMGGEARFGLINLGLSKGEEEEALELYEGIGEACRELKVAVIGGDTVKSRELFFDMTLIGRGKGLMLRSKAKPGELIGVTGSFGDSRGGLELLEKGEFNERLVRKFLSPQARVKEGVGAARLGVKCGTDVSDGLLFNLGTIAKASKVDLEIESSLIPISKELIEVFGEGKALELALYGGEDYELIITFPEKILSKVEEIGFKVIGEVKEGNGIVKLDGRKVKAKGYDHLKEES